MARLSTMQALVSSPLTKGRYSGVPPVRVDFGCGSASSASCIAARLIVVLSLCGLVLGRPGVSQAGTHASAGNRPEAGQVSAPAATVGPSTPPKGMSVDAWQRIRAQVEAAHYEWAAAPAPAGCSTPVQP
jgi:hypothetical protein